MKLKKFTKNKKQKRIVIGSIVGILLLIGGITLYRTFALYKVETSFDVLKGTVPDFSSGDVTLAFTVNDKKESGVPFPNKNEGFKVDGVTCDEGITADWDNNTWSLTNIKNSNSQSKIKCTINFKRYEEQLLNGSYPVLKEGLVPVNIDNSGKVTKADITQNWYEYGQKKWANAVILADGVEEPETGAPIEEKDIESYFVWIPKYRYKLFDDKLGRYSEVESGDYKDKGPNTPIEIEFGIENTKDDKEHNECATPNKSGEDGKCEVNMWMTHPAFTAFEDSKGFWIGKFETGERDATRSMATKRETYNEQDLSKIIIKPDSYALAYINVATSYQLSYNYQRSLDSHMMKNTEWGAVAYLSHSKYGTCNDKTCSEVRINNSENFVTGVSAKKDPTIGLTNSNLAENIYEKVTPLQNSTNTYTYLDPNSIAASTTGNYTGIYDMSGGAAEWVASTILDSNNQEIHSDSHLGNIFINGSQYYDIYKYSNNGSKAYNNRILGDAIGEMGSFSIKNYQNTGERFVGSWYEDWAYSFNATNGAYWYNRGATYRYGTNAGLFAFGAINLETHYNTFRIVLTP